MISQVLMAFNNSSFVGDVILKTYFHYRQAVSKPKALIISSGINWNGALVKAVEFVLDSTDS
jgi:hypothetical protein